MGTRWLPTRPNKEILQKKVASFGNPYHNTFDMFGQHSAEAAKSRLRVW